MMRNGANSVVHQTEERDAGSRPVKLMLKKPAIDVMAECKAFPRTLGKSDRTDSFGDSEEKIDTHSEKLDKIRRCSKDGGN